jgi:cytochrome c-type biogenesis protein CcmH
VIRPRRAAIAALAALIVLAAPALLPAAAGAATPRTSLTAIWNEVMCVSCHEPLSVAQSPQAYAERDYIRTLIAQGYTKPQIVHALVAQYGPAVLGKPPAQGFNLTVYVLPPAILLIGIATLAVTLPRWRRRARAAASRTATASPPLKPAENKRLDEELSRFAG